MEWSFFIVLLGMIVFAMGILPAISRFVEEMRDWHFEEYSRLDFPEVPNTWTMLLRGGGQYSEHELNSMKTMLFYIAEGHYRGLKDRRLINRGNWIRFFIYVVVGLLCAPLLLVFQLFGEWNT